MHIAPAACRIAKEFPEAKIVVLLRDPVMRAFSHWNMNRVMWGANASRLASFDREVEEELRALRDNRCSFEATGEAGGSAPSQRQGAAPQWVRDPRIPSWSQCFRCHFMWCGSYNGVSNVSTVRWLHWSQSDLPTNRLNSCYCTSNSCYCTL